MAMKLRLASSFGSQTLFEVSGEHFTVQVRSQVGADATGEGAWPLEEDGLVADRASAMSRALVSGRPLRLRVQEYQGSTLGATFAADVDAVRIRALPCFE